MSESKLIEILQIPVIEYTDNADLCWESVGYLSVGMIVKFQKKYYRLWYFSKKERNFKLAVLYDTGATVSRWAVDNDRTHMGSGFVTVFKPELLG